MKNFDSIRTDELTENSIKLIGQDWMLITAGSLTINPENTDKAFNTMTASWGGLGFLWNKPVAFIFVRPQRFTFKFTEQEHVFSLSFFEPRYRDALSLCGTVSGRNTNKIKDAGLTPIALENGSVAFNEASMIIECKKLYSEVLKAENFIDTSIVSSIYSARDFHTMYVGEITKIWKKQSTL